MNHQHMITFRCRQELLERIERFALTHNIDRTSVLKLALHYYLNEREYDAATDEMKRHSSTS